jgi:hypothetical protein
MWPHWWMYGTGKSQTGSPYIRQCQTHTDKLKLYSSVPMNLLEPMNEYIFPVLGEANMDTFHTNHWLSYKQHANQLTIACNQFCLLPIGELNFCIAMQTLFTYHIWSFAFSKCLVLLEIALEGVCFQFFVIFISFQKIKNWMVPKARSWKHLFMSFSASRFWGHPAFGSLES